MWSNSWSVLTEIHTELEQNKIVMGVGWRLGNIVGKVWGFSLKRGKMRDIHFRRYEVETKDSGEQFSNFRKGKSLIVVSGDHLCKSLLCSNYSA